MAISEVIPPRSGVEKQVAKSAWLHFAGAALFVASAFLVTYLLMRESDQVGWVKHTYMVESSINRVVLLVKSIESSSRAFVVTHDTKFLTDMQPMSKDANAQVDELGQLTSDNPRQRGNIELLRRAVKAKIGFSTETVIPHAQIGDFSTITKLIATGAGAQLMKDVETAAQKMTDEERHLLTIREAYVRGLQESVYFASAILGAIALIALVISFRSSVLYSKTQASYLEQSQQAEAEQKRISLQLERSNKDLQQFAYVASHDLQEPLRAVGGFLSLISEKYSSQLDPQADKWIQNAIDGAERMRVLINDLLSFARVETRGGRISLLDSSQALAEAMQNLAVSIDECQARIEVGELPSVYADKSQLIQVFQNLIGNSLKYKSAQTPQISIQAEPKNEEWEFSIRDNGIGFSMEHAERIFVIFQRLHTRADYAGTGIGLALCSRIIERHGGRIWATSEPGKGSIFYFTLPTKPRKEETNAAD